MKNKGKKILIVLLLLLISCSDMVFMQPYDVYAVTNNPETVVPMADGFVWRYKIVNGITYKRLYNCSKKKWVGNWIKC